MTGELTPIIAGLFGTMVGGFYLASVHFLPKWRNRRGVAHSADAGPAQPIRRKRREKKERRAFKAQSHKLQMEADSIDTARNRHVAWESVQSVASILDQLSIPHLSSDADPKEWRAFLAHMIVAARTGDIGRARAVMSDEKLGFMNVPEDFGAPGAAPSSDQDTIGTNGVALELVPPADDDDMARFRRDQGRGDLAARLIERAADFQKAEAIFNDWRNDREPRAMREAVDAMVARLRGEGPTAPALTFLHGAGVIDSQRRDSGEIDEKSFEWAVMVFEGLDGKDKEAR